MIGLLPKSLNVNGIERVIRTDFRVALIIFEFLQNPSFSDKDKCLFLMQALYVEPEKITADDLEEAIVQANWFLDGGKKYDDKNPVSNKKIMDWNQDEQMIFSAINKVANKEVRECEYLHWWTFLGYFNEIGEGIFSTVVNIRKKLNEGKKLEKYEQDFYKKNIDLIKIKTKLTEDEEELNKLLS